MIESIIYKYLAGETTIEEEQHLLEWIKTSPENKALFFEIKAIWHANHQRSFSKQEQQDILNHSLQQLNARIDNALKNRRSSVYRRIGMWGSAAAIALLLLAMYFIVASRPGYNEADMIVYTNYETDSVITYTLADGTNIWLDENSTLTYASDYGISTREVFLDGKAFFDVVKDMEHPFIVRTDSKLIKVVGTSFSVNTHSPGDMVETILMSGSVQLQRVEGESLTTLRPGQQALYSKENKILEINEVDVNSLTSWRYGLISLSEVSVKTILKCLEDTYQVKIDMDSGTISDRLYNFSFKRSKGVEAALEHLSIITGKPATIHPPMP